MVRRRLLLVFPLVVGLAGCGSTVQMKGSVAVPQGAADAGLSAPGAAGALGSPNDASAAGTGGTGSGTGPTVPGSSGSPSEPDGQLGAGQPGTAQPGKAAAAGAPIRLGVVIPDASALIAAFGATPPSDIFAPWKAQIAYLNAHGGIGGHRIDPVYVRHDATAQDGDNAAQTACTEVSDDRKVDIVAAAGMISDVFLTCLQKKGVSSFDFTPWVSDGADLARHPNLFAPDAVSVDRYARALIKVSVARGVLKSGDTLGVLTEDCPWGPRVYSNVVVPLARSYGVKTETATFSCNKSLSGQQVAAASSQTQQAALKFGSLGVTHVMALSAGEGFIIVQFQNNARGQRFDPKYLITTNAYPYNNGRRDGAVMFSEDALPNMSGIGFKPYIDVGDAAKPATAAQAAAQAFCRKMDPEMGGAKANTGKTHWQSVDTFYVTCDQMLTLKRVLEADGLRFDVASLKSGFQKVLRTAVGAAVASGSYAPMSNRRDGVGQVHPFVWNSSTQHFTYVGRPSRIS